MAAVRTLRMRRVAGKPPATQEARNSESTSAGNMVTAKSFQVRLVKPSCLSHSAPTNLPENSERYLIVMDEMNWPRKWLATIKNEVDQNFSKV
ncbi:hypothetical protein O9929_11850 [Vibrio lentus]|nr:hypothetical protein [Vibrio lentus]